MARAFDSTALTTAETVLFLAQSGSTANDGNPARVFEVTNEPTSSDKVLVQVTGLHGASEWFPIAIGAFRQFGSHNGARGLITQVKAKMKSGTGAVSGGAVDGN
jgi:hypothetical protein